MKIFVMFMVCMAMIASAYRAQAVVALPPDPTITAEARTASAAEHIKAEQVRQGRIQAWDASAAGRWFHLKMWAKDIAFVVAPYVVRNHWVRLSLFGLAFALVVLAFRKFEWARYGRSWWKFRLHRPEPQGLVRI